jgi:hypothetical protein
MGMENLEIRKHTQFFRLHNIPHAAGNRKHAQQIRIHHIRCHPRRTLDGREHRLLGQMGTENIKKY